MTEQIAPEEIIEKIKKLLNLAAKNPSEQEAAAALAKANELMERYNLTSETVERSGSDSGKREQANVEGGFYAFHRELWEAIADLNFCIYWTQEYIAKGQRTSIKVNGVYVGKGLKDQKKKRHCLVGRVVNVRATIVMAQYLLQAIERVLGDKLHGREDNMKGNWAWSYRQGAASTLVDQLKDRRRDREREEELGAEKAKRKAERAGVSTSMALTLSSFKKSEEDANQDFIHGEGWSAEQERVRMEARVKDAKRRRDMDAAYTAWAAANPKKARSEFEFTDDEGDTWHYNTRRGGGGRSSRYFDGLGAKVDRSAYYSGADDAKGISLDQQVGDRKSQKRIGR